MPDMRASLRDYKTPAGLLTFEPTPEAFPGDEAMDTRQWDVIEGPSVADTKNAKPPTYTLAGFFPGRMDYGQPWAREQYWREPKELIGQLRAWMRASALLRLYVSETDVDADVKLVSMRRRWGERDRVYYELDLIETAPLLITSIPAQQASEQPTSGSGVGVTITPNVGIGPRVVPETYTIKDASETLWAIAQRYYGNVEMWGEIWETNRAERGGPLLDFTGPYEPGTTLVMPQGQAGVTA